MLSLQRRHDAMIRLRYLPPFHCYAMMLFRQPPLRYARCPIRLRYAIDILPRCRHYAATLRHDITLLPLVAHVTLLICALIAALMFSLF